MNCDWKEAQAYSFAGNSMAPGEARAFAAHVGECPRCRSLVSEARGVDDLLRSALTPVTAPLTLQSRVVGAVAREREKQKKPWWSLQVGRLSLSPLSAMAVMLALLAASYIVAPGAVVAVVQRALLSIPGLGIRPMEEDHLVTPNPVVAKIGDLTLRVEALLSTGEMTTLSFAVTGLPGGKEKAMRVGTDEPPAAPKSAPPLPRLRDSDGREYQMTTGHYGVGGTPNENKIQGEMSFPPLVGKPDSVELMLPSDWIELASGLPSVPETWRIRIPLASASSSGLPLASPQGASVSARGVTFRVAALSAEAEHTVVLLEGKAAGGARVSGVGKNGGNVPEAVELRDNLGRRYALEPRGSQWSRLDAPYQENLYFRALLPLAQRLTLTVQSVRLTEEGSTKVTLPVEGKRSGEKVSLNRTVVLGSHQVVLESTRIEGDWLYVDVDLGPTVDGRTLSNFSVDGRGSFMTSMGKMNGEQMSYFGVELEPGQQEVELQLSHPLVNVDGPWEVSFPVGSR